MSKTSIVCYRTEELITLHHCYFAILGKSVKEYTKRKGCSNRVVDWALQCQLFLDEMRKKCPGWNPAHKQECSLFFLEWIFHNAAAMWCKENQRQSEGPSLEVEETAHKYPSVWALVGSQHSNILWVTEPMRWNSRAHDPSLEGHWPGLEEGVGWSGIKALPCMPKPAPVPLP